MVTILYVYIISQGVLYPPTTETYYTHAACFDAAKQAENLGIKLAERFPKTEISAYCTPKKLAKED